MIFTVFDIVEVHVKISFGHAAFEPAAPFRNEIWSNDTFEILINVVSSFPSSFPA